MSFCVLMKSAPSTDSADPNDLIIEKGEGGRVTLRGEGGRRDITQAPARAADALVLHSRHGPSITPVKEGGEASGNPAIVGLLREGRRREGCEGEEEIEKDAMEVGKKKGDK